MVVILFIVVIVLASLLLVGISVVVVVTIAVRIAREGFLHSLLVLLGELSLVVLFVVDGYEAWQPLIRGDATLTLKDVDHDAVRSLFDSLPGETSLFGKSPLV